jgi:transposase-like protein
VTERERSTMVTDPADIDPCPGCGGTSGVQPITGTSPRVQAWSCTACQTNWATTTVKTQPHLDRLAAAVEQISAPRLILRQVITMADDAATL